MSAASSPGRSDPSPAAARAREAKAAFRTGIAFVFNRNFEFALYLGAIFLKGPLALDVLK